MIICPETRFAIPRNSLVLLTIILVLSSVPFSAQTSDSQKPAPLAPAQNEAPAPTAVFKSSAELVLVPVVVKGRNGKSVTGLSKDVFRLEESGKEQTISLFEEIQPPPPAPASTTVADRGYSNIPVDSAGQARLTIIVLDLLNTSQFQRSDGRDQIVKFLSKGLPPNQPVSLVCITTKGVQPVHPFSSDTNSLIQALKKISLGAETIMSGQANAPGTGVFRENLNISTIAQITEIAQAYTGIPGRKTLIFAAGRIPGLATESQIFDASTLADDQRLMWRSLIEANISIYPMHLMEWSSNPARSGPGRNLDLRLGEFADSTGGNLCIESNEPMRCLTDAVDDSRSYYMLGFAVQPDDRKPGWRYLKVKVNVEHVNVRARNGFYYGNPAPPVEVPKRPQEINALASPLSNSGVPMYVKVLPPAPSSGSAPASGKKTVGFLITVPFNGIKIDPSSANPLDLDVGAIALTSKVKEAAELVHPVRGDPTPENLKQWARDGIKLQEKLELPPGSYDVRFFVRDNNTTQIGTVVFPLDVN
jgi:VWFA-related protein